MRGKGFGKRRKTGWGYEHPIKQGYPSMHWRGVERRDGKT